MTLTEQEAAQPLRHTHRVHAVLVTHDGVRWLPEVVRSLQGLTLQPESITVVDTDSHDKSLELVKPLSPLVLRADRNDGFGDAVALAVEHLPAPVEGVIEWIWLLHDDFAPDAQCLERLIRAVDDAPSVAVVGPKLRGWHDRSHLLEIGISIAGNGSRWTSLERRERDQGQHDGVHDVLAVSTAGMLVRRDVWEELEGLDPNISMFRDDVDFGWRARVAGHQVRCVTDAVGFHAEAVATERRPLDVQGALRRPHLLDRRQGAYVLLANCSPARIPLVFMRLVFSTILRATGYLFAKLPGYALDEIAGLLLFISRPDLLGQARRARKARRLLPARAVRPYLAPFGSQTRSAIEGIRDLLLRGWNRAVQPRTSYTVITEGDEDFAVQEEPLARRILVRPGVFLFVALSAVALISGRQRLGTISGGALLPSSRGEMPLGASDLFRFFVDAWHQIGLGSSTPAPTWVAVVAIASGLVAGNVSSFITLYFLLALPAAAMSMYALLRSRVTQHWYAAAGAFLYAVSPPVLTSITGGRLAGVTVALILPLAIKIMSTSTWSWRRIWFAGLVLAIAGSFTPLLLVIAIVAAGVRIYFVRSEWIRWATVVGSAFALNAPWSLAAIFHPSRWLGEPGLALSGGLPLSLLGLNPGGLGAPPTWLVSTLILAGLLLFAMSRQRQVLIAAGFVLAIAQIVAAWSVRLHDSGAPIRAYVGSLLIIVVGLILFATVSSVEEIVAELSQAHVGLRHFAAALVLLTSTLSAVGASAWFMITDAPLRGGRSEILPAFVAELSRTQEQKRTLVLDASGTQTHFGLLRGDELHLADADVAGEEPAAFSDAVSTLLAGADEQTIGLLNRYNIGFILMLNPLDQEVARTLDSVGGLTRLSVSDGKILWQVGGAHALVRLIDSEKNVTPLAQDGEDLRFSVPGPGVLQLSERSAGGWRAVASGKKLAAVPSPDGMQAFAISEPAAVVITYDNPAHRAGLALALATLLAALIAIAPGGRRLSEQSDEEVS